MSIRSCPKGVVIRPTGRPPIECIADESSVKCTLNKIHFDSVVITVSSTGKVIRKRCFQIEKYLSIFINFSTYIFLDVSSILDNFFRTLTRWWIFFSNSYRVIKKCIEEHGDALPEDSIVVHINSSKTLECFNKEFTWDDR